MMLPITGARIEANLMEKAKQSDAEETEEEERKTQPSKVERRERRGHDVTAKARDDERRSPLRSQGAVDVVDSAESEVPSKVRGRGSGRARHDSIGNLDRERWPAYLAAYGPGAKGSNPEPDAATPARPSPSASATAVPAVKAKVSQSAPEPESIAFPDRLDANEAARDEDRELQHSAEDTVADAAEEAAQEAADREAQDDNGDESATTDRRDRRLEDEEDES